jgi:hypothetical protein
MERSEHMMRKIAIGLAAAVVATGATTLTASACRGGYAKSGAGKADIGRTGNYRPGPFGPQQYGEFGRYRHERPYGYERGYERPYGYYHGPRNGHHWGGGHHGFYGHR